MSAPSGESPPRCPAVATALVIATLAFSSPAQAGWTRPPGELYLKLYNRLAIGPGGYTAGGAYVDFGFIAVDTSLQIYAEYGALEGVTVVAGGVPFGFSFGGGDETPYVGPLWAGFRLGSPEALLANLHVALEVRYGFSPGWGEVALFGGVVNGEAWRFAPTEQTHLFDGELQLGYGLPWGLWASARAGMRYGTRDQWDAIAIGHAQLGWSSSVGVVLEAHVNVYQPLHTITRNNLSGAGPTRYVGAGLSVSYWVREHWAISAGVEGGLAFEANFAAPVITLGVEYLGVPGDPR